MKKKNIEIILYAALFCLAAGLRFYQLGATPLTENEAAAAINALNLSKGSSIIFDAQAGYILLTSILFTIFQASEFWARFFPAIAGSAIIFCPLLFKKQLGAFPVLLMVAAFALEPSLIIASRTASGTIFGIVFFLFALGFLLNNKYELAGVFFGLSFLGGTSLWFGILVLLITAACVLLLRKTGKTGVINHDSSTQPDKPEFRWKSFLIPLIVTLVLVFSRFIATPSGLGGVFSGLSGFVQGWLQPASMQIGVSLWSLLFYEIFPLILGIFAISVALQRNDSVSITLSIFTLAAFLLIILYPGRDFSIFPWLAIPLWVLITKYLLSVYNLDDVEKVPYFGLLAILFIAMIFAGMNLTGIFTDSVQDAQAMQLHIASVLGGLLLMILATGLTIWSWAVTTGAKAVFGTVFVLLFVLNLSTIWNILTSVKEHKQEVWLTSYFVDEDLLVDTIKDYEKWNIGSGNQSTLMVSAEKSNGLDWALRDIENVEQEQALTSTYSPEMIITETSQQELLLTEEYAGQDFILSREPVWKDLNALGWAKWYMQRQTPYVDQSIILWVRVDQFPGYEANELLPTE